MKINLFVFTRIQKAISTYVIITMSKITKFWSLKRKWFRRGLNYLWSQFVDPDFRMSVGLFVG